MYYNSPNDVRWLYVIGELFVLGMGAPLIVVVVHQFLIAGLNKQAPSFVLCCARNNVLLCAPTI